jgi:hypothetical protein
MQSLTPKEAEILDAIKELGSVKAASKVVGGDTRTFYRRIKAIKLKGYDIGAAKILGQKEGFEVHSASTLVKHTDEGGNVVMEWIKQSKTAEDMEAFVKRLEERVAGKGPRIKQPNFADTAVSLWIPMGDPHFGMYAWAKETGADYDVEKADQIHSSALSKIIKSRPYYDQITIVSLGDLLHADNRRQMTEKSGHLLDVDGRYWRVVDVVTDCFCRAIELAATRTKKVRVILLDGNHDPHSSGHVARTLAAYYRKTKHIDIDTRVTKHRYEVYGNNLIGMVHGDTTKSLAQLPGLMACDQREAWGATHNHYWWTGHIHQQKVFEYPSCVVESFNSMTEKDAYAAEYGYRSRRQMTGIEIHKEHGEVSRIMVRPEHFV